MRVFFSVFLIALCSAGPAVAQQEPAEEKRLQPVDVFELEWADDPQVAPDGKTIVYVRRGFDIMTDKAVADLWTIRADGTGHRPLLSAKRRYGSPRLSPDGTKLAYTAAEDGAPQIYVRWLDTGQTARVTNLTEAPSNLSWSPDGTRLAFTMRVAETPKPFAIMPAKPEGAEWAPPVKVIDRLTWRLDGRGYVEPGYTQIFVVPAEGGTPRQLTFGKAHHDSLLSWTPDGRSILFSANIEEGWEYEPVDTEIYALDVETAALTQITFRQGPDNAPVVSPDGKTIAYTGFNDERLGYHVPELYVMDRDGTGTRSLTAELDRRVRNPQWRPDGKGVYFLYEDAGVTKLGYAPLKGKVQTLAENLGGTSLGRPYASGDYAVGADGTLATVITTPQRPADLALVADGKTMRLTALNEDLLGHKELAQIEEIRVKSQHDGMEIQAWILKPPGFEADRSYPMILEIHGGPFADYGPRFSAEMQLFAARGYLVVYANPRGSSSYGKAFGNLIHHAYPGDDYDDLMSVVDAAVEKGYADPEQLFVTGGSGGGVLTAWIVGSTDRFAAAVVAKPVINWASFVLTADFSNLFARYWFPAMPWEAPEHYWQRSPLSLVGNVTTPTMLLTGDADYRTPISETEQFYQALKLRQVDTALVRVPGASHGIAARPSNLIAKVINILGWFERYGGPKG